METLDQQASNDLKRKNRTEQLIIDLGLDPKVFFDPKLPKGLFSHSQYVSWRICARAYEYKYVEKIRTPNYPATTKGSSVHAGIEFMLLGKKNKQKVTVAEGEAVVSDIFDKDAEAVLEWDADTPQDKVKDSAISLFRHFAVHALPRINPVAIEKGFARRFGDVPMIGWIDLVDEQPAIVVAGLSPEQAALAPVKRITVDFKTGKAKWSENELRLDTQLTMYAAQENTPDVRVDQLLAKKSGPEYIRGESIRTQQDIAVFTEDLNEVAEFVKKGVFPKAPIDSWVCNPKHCSFWHMCRGKQR